MLVIFEDPMHGLNFHVVHTPINPLTSKITFDTEVYELFPWQLNSGSLLSAQGRMCTV